MTVRLSPMIAPIAPTWSKRDSRIGRSNTGKGEFEFVGIRAAVELPIPFGKDRILTRIESPGLWGIESDSGEDYLESVFQEESNILADMLAELGVKVH